MGRDLHNHFSRAGSSQLQHAIYIRRNNNDQQVAYFTYFTVTQGFFISPSALGWTNYGHKEKETKIEQGSY